MPLKAAPGRMLAKFIFLLFLTSYYPKEIWLFRGCDVSIIYVKNTQYFNSPTFCPEPGAFVNDEVLRQERSPVNAPR